MLGQNQIADWDMGLVFFHGAHHQLYGKYGNLGRHSSSQVILISIENQAYIASPSYSRAYFGTSQPNLLRPRLT